MTTSPETPDRRQALDMIRADAEADAKALDGQPLDGRVVGTNLGQIYASIHALAGILQTVLDDLEQLSRDGGAS